MLQAHRSHGQLRDPVAVQAAAATGRAPLGVHSPPITQA